MDKMAKENIYAKKNLYNSILTSPVSMLYTVDPFAKFAALVCMVANYLVPVYPYPCCVRTWHYLQTKCHLGQGKSITCLYLNISVFMEHNYCIMNQSIKQLILNG